MLLIYHVLSNTYVHININIIFFLLLHCKPIIALRDMELITVSIYKYRDTYLHKHFSSYQIPLQPNARAG